MSSSIDIDRLGAILRDAAIAEIMPRFRRLAVKDVRQKTSATDLVTEADEAAERFIMAECARAFPDAVFIGEEFVASDERVLEKVGTAELAIVVDPIDGTANFAAGAPLFAVMAAVVAGGETIAGIIYDPLGDDFVMAEKGSGAALKRRDGETVPIRCAGAVPVSEMVGVASHNAFPPSDRRAFMANLSAVRIAANYRCAGQEYRLLATGHLHFAVYQELMPWDHLAGSLIVEEAGGHIRRLDGSAYLPGHVGGGLIAACDAASWRALRETLFPERAAG